MGDWSTGKQMKNFISAPNSGLKRKLNEHYNVHNLDEFITSLLNCKNKQSRCINRDENLVNNMIMLTNYYLQHKDCPEKFKRSYKLMDYQIKDTNPNSNISVKCLSSPL